MGLMRARLRVVEKGRVKGDLMGRHSRSMAHARRCYRGFFDKEMEMATEVTAARGRGREAMCRCM
jgi:hypothetical protein